MGALTLGIVVPSGSVAAGGPPVAPAVATTGVCASSAVAARVAPWIDDERQTAADLGQVARALGWAVEIISAPALDSRRCVAALAGRMRSVDALAIAAHGPRGGSGALHRLALAVGRLPPGPQPLAIARAFDKLAARRRLAAANLPVPRTVVLDEARAGLDRLGWPAVIKPRRGAAGAGVRRICDPGELARVGATDELLDEPLIEAEVVGREFSLVIWNGELLGMAELVTDFVDGRPRSSALVCPPQLHRSERAGLVNLALRACESLDLEHGPTRVDLLLCERGNEVILEVEPLPALHRNSVVARVARAAGLPYPRLAAQLLGLDARLGAGPGAGLNAGGPARPAAPEAAAAWALA